MQRFTSTLDGRIWVPVGLLFTALAVLFVVIKLWAALVFILLAVAFILHLILTTSYTITPAGELIIRCGFLYRQRLFIRNIEKVVHTTNPLSSPALSLNRLELWYEKRGRVMISPKGEDLFVAALRRHNLHLVVH